MHEHARPGVIRAPPPNSDTNTVVSRTGGGESTGYPLGCVVGPAFSFDQGILQAVGDAALGVVNTSQWNKDIDNATNAAFVETFQSTDARLMQAEGDVRCTYSGPCIYDVI